MDRDRERVQAANDEVDSASTWRRPNQERPRMPSSGSGMMRGYESRGGSGFDRPSGGFDRPSGGFDRPSGGFDRSGGGFERPTRSESRGGEAEEGNWRTGPSAEALPPTTSTKRHNFSAVMQDLPRSNAPAQNKSEAPPSVPKKADPALSPTKSENNFLNRAAPSRSVPAAAPAATPPTSSPPAAEPPKSESKPTESKPMINPRAQGLMDPVPMPTEEKPWQKVETRLERTREMSSPPAAGGPPLAPAASSVGSGKKSLDSLFAKRPSGQAAASGVYKPKSQQAAPQAEEEKVEKRKRKPNDKKAAIREMNRRKAAAKNRMHKNELGKGSENDISTVIDKLEPLFDEDNDVSAEAILDAIQEAQGKAVFESTLVLACVIALCVREVIHHAEGSDEQGIPADASLSSMEELVDSKLLPEARENWKRALPAIEAFKKRSAFKADFNYVLLREIMRICAKSGCPSRLSPSITLAELMTLALMQTTREFISPSLVLDWEADIDDETEGRTSGLVQTTNLVKWLKGGLVAESDDENSGESDNE